MASTSETAIIWAIMFMGISTMATLLNFAGPTGTTFFSGGLGLSDSLVISQNDFNSLTSTFQLPSEVTDDTSPSTSFAFINQGVAVGGFVLKTIFSLVAGWSAIVVDAVFTFPIPLAMQLAVVLIFVAPFVVMNLIGLLEIARRIKDLIPFI